MRALARLTAAATVVVLPLAAVPAAAQDAADPIERERIESIVRDYLLRNPEIIVEAMQVLEQRERVAAEARREEAMTALIPTLSASPLTPIVGPEDADVTLVEFFDYQCGYCKRMLGDLRHVMENDDKLKVIFVEYPALGPASVVAARAALAAKGQGKYLEYHLALMEYQGRLDEGVIFGTAERVGLDVPQLKQDMAKPEIEGYLRSVRGLADQLGVRGTPTLVVGDAFIPGYIKADELQRAIAVARGAAEGTSNGTASGG